jgi:hypothetical protein
MIHNKKEFNLGLVLFVGFWGVFVVSDVAGVCRPESA